MLAVVCPPPRPSAGLDGDALILTNTSIYPRKGLKKDACDVFAQCVAVTRARGHASLLLRARTTLPAAPVRARVMLLCSTGVVVEGLAALQWHAPIKIHAGCGFRQESCIAR